jgi:hypothetical protein
MSRLQREQIAEDLPMQNLKDAVSFEEEILPTYERENRGSKGYAVGLDYLRAANRRCHGKWTLALLSKVEIANVTVPAHRHPAELIPDSGLSVAAAALRVPQFRDLNPECWERISAQENRDFSQTHICLALENGVLKHVDGVHRLLAYVLFEKDTDVPTYVADYS